MLFCVFLSSGGAEQNGESETIKSSTCTLHVVRHKIRDPQILSSPPDDSRLLAVGSDERVQRRPVDQATIYRSAVGPEGTLGAVPRFQYLLLHSGYIVCGKGLLLIDVVLDPGRWMQ